MTTFTNVFGNETVPPSDYRYAAYTLSASDTLVWPENYSGETGLLSASILDLTASGPGFTLTLPPADEVSTGRDILLRNVGGNSIEILQDGGASLVVLGTGQSRYLYITDNSTAAGTWQAFTFGTGTSAADAALLAGSGLQANAGVLRIAAAYKSLNANYTLLTSDRAKLLDVVAGSTTINLLQSSTVGDGYIVYIRNSSAGSVVLDAFGTETIDGSLTLTLFPDESLALLNNGSAWKSVGYGRDATFVFSEIVVDASLPSTVLSSADVAGRMIRVAGVATGNITVELPAIDNIYFVNTESGVGAFNVTFTTGAGTDVVLGADQKTVLYSDGTNVTTAITTSLTSTVQFADGSAAVPSINFALDLDTGFFRPGSGSVAFTSDGVQTVTLTDKGIFNIDGTAAEPSYSLTSDSTTGIYSAGPGALGITIAGVAEAVFSSAGLELADPLAVTEGGTGADTASGARTSLGLVAGGAGDIWVEKAGDTMTGLLVLNQASDQSGEVLASLRGTLSAVGNGHGIEWRQGSGTFSTGFIRCDADGTTGATTDLKFGLTSSFGGTDAATRMTLSATGKWRMGFVGAVSTTLGDLDIQAHLRSAGLSASGAGCEVTFGNGDTAGAIAATVSGVLTGADASGVTGRLAFATRATTVGALTERLRVNEDGASTNFTLESNRIASGSLAEYSLVAKCSAGTAYAGRALISQGSTFGFAFSPQGSGVLATANMFLNVVNVATGANQTEVAQFHNSRGVISASTAKAHVNFDGTGVVAIRRSLNVSSITDSGVGLYTVNLTVGTATGAKITIVSVGSNTGSLSSATAGFSGTTGVSLNVTNGTVLADNNDINVVVYDQ